MVVPYSQIKKAAENSIKKFGEKTAQKRAELFRKIRFARQKDAAESGIAEKGEERHRWGISFNASLKELNKFYDINLASELLKLSFAKSGYSLLEIGGGSGRAAKELAKILKGKIRITSTGVKRVPQWVKGEGVDWRLVHSQNLAKAFKPESFNFIHSNLGISHSTEFEKTIQDCRKLLKKGGRLLFTTDIGTHSYIEEKHFDGFRILRFDEKNQKSGNLIWVYYLEKL